MYRGGVGIPPGHNGQSIADTPTPRWLAWWCWRARSWAEARHLLMRSVMRSPIGPILIILGLVTSVVLVLVLLQTIGLRGELVAARGEVGVLRTQVEDLDRGVPMSELSMELAELENDIRDWVVAFGGNDDPADGDPSSPAGGATANAEVLDRLDDVLARIDDLDARIDEICANVPVC